MASARRFLAYPTDFLGRGRCLAVSVSQAHRSILSWRFRVDLADMATRPRLDETQERSFKTGQVRAVDAAISRARAVVPCYRTLPSVIESCSPGVLRPQHQQPRYRAHITGRPGGGREIADP